MIAGWLLLAAIAGPDYTPAVRERVYDRVCALVQHRYWNKPRLGPAWQARCALQRPAALAASDRAGFYAQLNELLDGLDDSHLFAVDPVRVSLDRQRERGRTAQGYGLVMAPDAAGRWIVTQLRPDGPAARAGVRVGWTVAAVDGRPVDIDAQPRPGERARFRFVANDDTPVERNLTAEEEMPLPARRETPLPGSLLLLALDGFEPGDERWLADRLATRPAGVILDLRQNDGGDADVIARVAGRFFGANRPLVDRIAARHSVQRTIGAGAESFLGPLALLIGPESASGAEALAALMEESGRGIMVGARTAGALTGAALYRLPDGGELSVAEFDIRTPGGRRLEGVGLTPAVTVTPTEADRRAGTDPVLARAAALLRARITP
jgi:carboxyl-terminal processing protease